MSSGTIWGKPTKKRIVYLYGGPGAGKSTVAMKLAALAKEAGLNVELVREYIKNWVWEDRDVLPGDQMYICAKQSRAERILFNDLELIVSDSPVWLSQYYERKNDVGTYQVSQHMIAKHIELAHNAGFEFVHIFLNRIKPYNPSGRFQTEEEAREVDVELKEMLTALQLPFTEVDANPIAASVILQGLISHA